MLSHLMFLLTPGGHLDDGFSLNPPGDVLRMNYPKVKLNASLTSFHDLMRKEKACLRSYSLPIFCQYFRL